MLFINGCTTVDAERGDYLGSLEATLQYSNSHLSLTGQLLVVKGWLLGEAGDHLTNNIITNILNFIYQWLHNCWCWRGNYLGSLEATLQYSNSHLSLTGQLLVVKGWLLWEAGGGEAGAGDHLTNNIITNILKFIYQWLHNCWCWRGGYLGSLEATLQYSNSYLSLTGQLLVVKGWLLGEAGDHLTNNIITNILNFIDQWLHNCWCWRGGYLRSLEATLQYSKLIYTWLGNC